VFSLARHAAAAADVERVGRGVHLVPEHGVDVDDFLPWYIKRVRGRLDVDLEAVADVPATVATLGGVLLARSGARVSACAALCTALARWSCVAGVGEGCERAKRVKS